MLHSNGNDSDHNAHADKEQEIYHCNAQRKHKSDQYLFASEKSHNVAQSIQIKQKQTAYTTSVILYSYTSCSGKVVYLIFGSDFCECKPICKVLSLVHFQGNSPCT